jgi:hypothetical protein
MVLLFKWNKHPAYSAFCFSSFRFVIIKLLGFWEKDENMRNRAFSYEAAPDLLVITCIADNKLGNQQNIEVATFGSF